MIIIISTNAPKLKKINANNFIPILLIKNI